MTKSRRSKGLVMVCLKESAKRETTRIAAFLALSLLVMLSASPFALADVSEANGANPTGLLIPLTPKMDIEASEPAPKSPPSETLLIPLTPKIDTAKPTDTAVSAPAPSDNETANQNSDTLDQLHQLKPPPLSLSAERGPEEDEDSTDTQVDENTTLKGTIQIVADDTEYDDDTNTFIGTGNAVVIIGGENSKLEADTILYDQKNGIIDARGEVRITRDGQLSTGSAFKFKVSSDEYLITNPNTVVNGSTVIARKAYGKGPNTAFRYGTVQMPQPFVIERSTLFGPTSFSEQALRVASHPDAYVPSHPSFVFKARKMTYEPYNDSGDGNLTIFGGRMVFGNFSLPVPKFNMNIGKEDTRVTFPTSFEIGNNLQMGGTSFGPSFNYGVGKRGIFEVSPLIQIGGATSSTTGVNQTGKVGLGERITYESDRVGAHFAYGSVSNLVVADYKYQFNKHLKFQSGINRYLDDGIFGVRRARLLAELVDYHSVSSIPYLASLTFRTSGGWAQDNADLLNLTPQYAKLFNIPANTTKKPSAYRFQEQISASTHPLVAVGDDKLGAKLTLFGGLGLRGYSTGNAMAMAQMGPILDVHLDRLRLVGGYIESAVKGSSPFVFDEFIQGSRSTFVSGDVKLANWLTLGGTVGYNLDAKLLSQRTVTAAIGPGDVKFILSYDTIRGINRYGFNVLFGQPIPFEKMLMKNTADQGQMGGGI